MQRDADVPKALATVSVGIREDGTAEIGAGAGLPAGGLCGFMRTEWWMQ